MGKHKISRITVAECVVCPILIIANWQCSIASARQPCAACTRTPSTKVGLAPISPLLSNLYMRRFVLGWKKLGHEKRLKAYIIK